MRDKIFINKVQVGADPGSEKPEAYTIWGALLKKKKRYAITNTKASMKMNSYLKKTKVNHDKLLGIWRFREFLLKISLGNGPRVLD